jgi:Domain of unknown function (DUF4396)
VGGAGGRPASKRWQNEHGGPPPKPGWAVTATGVSHCGAGCTLGDIAAGFTVFGLGASVAGLRLGADYIGDYLSAVALGIAFRYFAIAPMRGLPPGKALLQAAKVDIASLTAFEVGLFGWMAIMALLFPAPHQLSPACPVYWFGMQLGMVAGFFTAWPVNAWLIRAGIKEPM